MMLVYSPASLTLRCFTKTQCLRIRVFAGVFHWKVKCTCWKRNGLQQALEEWFCRHRNRDWPSFGFRGSVVSQKLCEPWKSTSISLRAIGQKHQHIFHKTCFTIWVVSFEKKIIQIVCALFHAFVHSHSHFQNNSAMIIHLANVKKRHHAVW